jgi:hypothetical protein
VGGRRDRGILRVGAAAGASAPTAAYFSTATRAWEFALGALLAAGVPLLRRLPAALGALLAWIGVAGIVASLVLIDDRRGLSGAVGGGADVATALALTGGVTAPPRALFLWTNPVAVVVGNASYSLYLWHFPVVVFAAALLPASPWSLPLTWRSSPSSASRRTRSSSNRCATRRSWVGGCPRRRWPSLRSRRSLQRMPPRPPCRGSRCGAGGADARDRDAASRGVAAGHALLPRQSADGGPERAAEPVEVVAASVPEVVPVEPVSAPPSAAAPRVPSVAMADSAAGAIAAPMTAWRERFRTQVALAAAGLVAAALLVVLVVQVQQPRLAADGRGHGSGGARDRRSDGGAAGRSRGGGVGDDLARSAPVAR